MVLLLVLVVMMVVVVMMMNDSIVVGKNVCKCVPTYIYLPKCESSISTYSHIHLYSYLYLPTNQAFLNPHTINKKKQAPSITVSYSSPPLPVPRACACVCVYSVYIYELMEGFSSLSCSAPKKKKRNVRFGGFAPPPHVMVHYTYSHN